MRPFLYFSILGFFLGFKFRENIILLFLKIYKTFMNILYKISVRPNYRLFVFYFLNLQDIPPPHPTGPSLFSSVIHKLQKNAKTSKKTRNFKSFKF